MPLSNQKPITLGDAFLLCELTGGAPQLRLQPHA